MLDRPTLLRALPQAMQEMSSRITSGSKAMQDMTIGERLRLIRADLRLSQTRMAEALSMPYGTYQAYEQDRHEQKAALLARLGALGVNLHWVLTGNGPMQLESASPRGLAEEPVSFTGHPPNDLRLKEGVLIDVDPSADDRSTT